MNSNNRLNLPVSVPAFFPAYSPSQKVPALLWCGLAVLTALGSMGISQSLSQVWGEWTGIPLQSIGMLIVPVALVLVLRVWRQNGWELHGSSWGLLPLALAFLLDTLRQDVILFWSFGRWSVPLLPHVFPLYLYCSGVILLFAGWRVWRQAWFPLALLVMAKPVPSWTAYFDLPLQRFSARMALSFAALIHFSPAANPQMLKMMFTPDFGMFIAPGCDGMRGAITMGYLALIIGYLKRVSIPRWFLYVTGAVLLGYLFNLVRLCVLVLYYRIAVGHAALENIAKQADYVIGGCLFMGATFFFLWIVFRKEGKLNSTDNISISASSTATNTGGQLRKIYWKVAVFVLLALSISGASAFTRHRGSVVPPRSVKGLTPSQLDERMPKQIGQYTLNRAWQQQQDNATAIESAAYATEVSDEVILGVWLLDTTHNINDSWMIHGKVPKSRSTRRFVTAQGRIIDFDTAFYSDGITDSFVGNAMCDRSSCFLFRDADGMHAGLQIVSSDGRMIPILFRVEKLHSNAPEDVVCRQLVAEAQSFLTGADMMQLSQQFQ